MSRHGEILELLPLYVLGALDGTPDCELVCEHLATGCVACAEELAEHARTAAALAASVPPATPRPELRALLEKRLGEARPEAPRRKVARLPSRLPSLALAAAAIAAMAILSAFYFQDALRRERSDNFLANKRLVEMETQNRGLEERAARDAAVVAALQGGGSVFELAPAAGQAGAGRIVWDRAHRRWILLASGLAAPPAEKAYELWFIAGKEKVPAGTFRPDEEGNVRHEIAIPPGLEKIDVGAVTLEPAAGVAVPTGPIVIAGRTT